MSASGNSQETLKKQCDLLNAKLGLDAMARLGFDTTSLYSPEDFKVEIKIKEEPSGKVSLIVEKIKKYLTKASN